MPHSTRTARLVSLITLLAGAGSARLTAQHDGALSLDWGAGDGFATWQWSGQVFLETAVATNDLLYGVGDYDFPAGTRSLHFQAVDKNGEIRSDRSCRDSTGAFGSFTDESGGEAAILDASGNLLIGGWVNFDGDPLRLHALLARYEIDQPGCTLDESFSTDGLRLFDTQSYCDPESCIIVALAEIRPETGAVGAPRTVALLRATVAISSYRYFLLGLTTAGSLDPGFGAGTSGIQEVVRPGLGTLRSGASMAVDDQGRILVLLTRLEVGTTSDLDAMALRFTADGDFDDDFSGDGLLAIRDLGIDDSFEDVAVELLAVSGGWSYFASIRRGSQWHLIAFDSEVISASAWSATTAAELTFQGDDRLLLAGEDLLSDGFLTRRLQLFSGGYDYDPTYGSEPDGMESYDLDLGGGSGQQIVDFLLWNGRPVVVGNASDVDGASSGFLMRAENGYLFADSFEGGNRGRWWGY